MGIIASCCAATACSCCVGLSFKCCGAVFKIEQSSATRIWYTVIFLAYALLMIPTVYWSYYVVKYIPYLNDECPREYTKEDCIQWVGALDTYKLSFALSVYHAFLGLLLIGVNNSKNARAQFQGGWWGIKIFLLIAMTIGFFFIPSIFYVYYGWVALFGAIAFVLIQVILLIDFAHSWSENWVAKWEGTAEEGEDKKWYYLLWIITIAFYIAIIGMSVTMYILFCNAECWFNAVAISINLVLVVLISVISVLPQIQEFNPRVGLLQAGIIGVFITYMVWSSILSEPIDACLGPFSVSTYVPNWISLIVGAMFTLVAVLYCTLRGGSSDIVGKSAVEERATFNALAPEVDVEAEEDEHDDEVQSTAYNYSFFHLTYLLGSMYLCMLFTNWYLLSSSKRSSSAPSDVGWVSVGVKFASIIAAVLLYCWSVFAPAILRNRDFGFE